MNRGAIPEYDMHEAGPEHLRRRGILVMRFMDSVRSDPRRLKPHFHEFFQMYILEGDAGVMLDFEEFDARGSTVVFLSPGQVHTVRPGKNLGGVTVSFTQSFFDDAAPPPSKLLEFPFFFPDEVKPWLSLPDGQAAEIAGLFQSLWREFHEGQEGAEEVLRATLRILLVRVARLFAKQAPPPKVTRAMSLVRQFHLAVEQHFREAHALGAYARMLGVTENHLNDTVRAQTGRSAGELLRRRRLLDAKRMLSHSDMSVSEIGYELGFPDPSYFARFFRRYEEVTPVDFREKIREKYQ
jgi:AraC-like DNA-binding protein